MQLLAGFLFFSILTLAWIQHVVTCVNDERIFLLFMGMILFPVGIIHGLLIWLGVM